MSEEAQVQENDSEVTARPSIEDIKNRSDERSVEKPAPSLADVQNILNQERRIFDSAVTRFENYLGAMGMRLSINIVAIPSGPEQS